SPQSGPSSLEPASAAAPASHPAYLPAERPARVRVRRTGCPPTPARSAPAPAGGTTARYVRGASDARHQGSAAPPGLGCHVPDRATTATPPGRRPPPPAAHQGPPPATPAA